MKRPDILVVSEVAAVFRVSKITIKRWCKQGKLPYFRINARGDMRFKNKDIVSYIEKSNANKNT